jgi:hypothetical protein
MIKVYLEMRLSSEHIANFADEEVYAACTTALEKFAEHNNGKITESVVEEELRS